MFHSIRSNILCTWNIFYLNFIAYWAKSISNLIIILSSVEFALKTVLWTILMLKIDVMSS